MPKKNSTFHVLCLGMEYKNNKRHKHNNILALKSEKTTYSPTHPKIQTHNQNSKVRHVLSRREKKNQRLNI